jgi:hypothetical protein
MVYAGGLPPTRPGVSAGPYAGRAAPSQGGGFSRASAPAFRGSSPRPASTPYAGGITPPLLRPQSFPGFSRRAASPLFFPRVIHTPHPYYVRSPSPVYFPSPRVVIDSAPIVIERIAAPAVVARPVAPVVVREEVVEGEPLLAPAKKEANGFKGCIIALAVLFGAISLTFFVLLGVSVRNYRLGIGSLSSASALMIASAVVASLSALACLGFSLQACLINKVANGFLPKG